MLIRLDHPNIVRIYDIVTEKDVPYIVMGFVQGTSWKETLRQERRPAARKRGAAPTAGDQGRV